MTFNHRYVILATRISQSKNGIFNSHVRYMKNKRRGLKEQPRKKPLDIEKKIKNTMKYEEKMNFDNMARGELFMPESCKSKKLAMLCNRLFYFNINDADLLDRYANRATGIANSMNTKDMSLILNTMAKFNHKHEKLLETFAKCIPSKLNKAVPQDISLILNAYAKLHFVDTNLFNRICEEIPHKIPHLEPAHMASILNAFVKLQIKDKIIINELTEEIIERIEEFDTKSLVNVINSFSKLKYISEPPKNIWITFVKAVQRLEKEFNFLEVVLIINALMKKVKNEKWYTFFNNLLNYHLIEKKSLNLQNSFLLPVICHAFAAQKYYVKYLFDIMVSYFADSSNYESLTTENYSQLIYAFLFFHSKNILSIPHTATIDETTMKKQDSSEEAFQEKTEEHDNQRKLDTTEKKKNFLKTFTDVSCTKMEQNQLNERTISTIAYCFAKLQVQNKFFFISLSSYLMKQKLKLSAQSLSLLCYSYSKLLIKSEILFYFLSIQILQNINLFTKQGLSIIVFSFAKLKIFNVQLFSLINKYINLYLDTCNYTDCIIISKKYEEIIKLMEEESNIKEQRNHESKYLIEFGNVKGELKKVYSALKEKGSTLEKINASKKQKKVTETEEVEQGDGDAFESEAELFSLFVNNENCTNSSTEEVDETTDPLIKSDTFINKFYNTDDIKKKEETLKIYGKMFSDNWKRSTYPNDFVESDIVQGSQNNLINGHMQQNLLNAAKEKDNRKPTLEQEKESAKSLIDLLMNNEKKMNIEKDPSIQSAEETEREFIKSYIEESNEGHESASVSDNTILEKTTGRSSKKKKKKSQWYKKTFEPANDFATLQKQWKNNKNIYQK